MPPFCLHFFPDFFWRVFFRILIWYRKAKRWAKLWFFLPFFCWKTVIIQEVATLWIWAGFLSVWKETECSSGVHLFWPQRWWSVIFCRNGMLSSPHYPTQLNELLFKDQNFWGFFPHPVFWKHLLGGVPNVLDVSQLNCKRGYFYTRSPFAEFSDEMEGEIINQGILAHEWNKSFLFSLLLLLVEGCQRKHKIIH